MHRIHLLLLTLAVCASARAQEIEVPLDSAGTVHSIDAVTAQRLGMFGEYAGFREARLFQTTDSEYVLEISYQPQDRLLRKRDSLAAAQVDSLRQAVTRRMRATVTYGPADESGRAKFLAGTTLIGLGFYGWAVPLILDTDDSRTAAALYMLTSGSSFVVPYLISRNTPISSAEAGLALYGGTRGILHGMALYGLLGGGNGTGEGVLLLGMAGSIGEMVGGYQWAHRADLSPGVVSTVATGGDFGLIFGGAAGLLMAENEMRHTEDVLPGEDHDDANDNSIRKFTGAVLVGSAAGILTGNWLTKRQEYTKGDAYVLREAGFLGLGAAWTIVALAEGSSQAAEAATMAGVVGGLALGHRLTRDVNFSASQGTLIGLSELGGALFGLGAAYLITDSDEPGPYWTGATLGAAAGFTLAYRAFARQTRIRDGSSLGIELAPRLFTTHFGGATRAVPGATIHLQF